MNTNILFEQLLAKSTRCYVLVCEGLSLAKSWFSKKSRSKSLMNKIFYIPIGNEYSKIYTMQMLIMSSFEILEYGIVWTATSQIYAMYVLVCEGLSLAKSWFSKKSRSRSLMNKIGNEYSKIYKMQMSIKSSFEIFPKIIPRAGSYIGKGLYREFNHIY